MTTRHPLRHPRTVYIEYLEKRIAPATFVVTNLNDSGPGSLRDAVGKANVARGTDTIVFRGDATNGELSLSSGEIDITDSMNIKGPGAGNLIIDAQNLSRIFSIDDNTRAVKKVTISGLSMVDGNSGTESSGGGILSMESLTLIDSVISGCVAFSDGGAISMITSGKLIISGSVLTGNSAGSFGGGAVSTGAAGGVQILSTLIAHNSTEGFGGGLLLSGGADATGDIVISRSTITDNSSAYGGGISAENDREVRGVVVGKITIRDTVISNNSASTSAGGLVLNGGNVLIERSHIVNNTADRTGGGISSGALESLTIRDSELLNNRTTAAYPYAARGGAIYINGGNRTVIQRTLVSDNTSSLGGGIAAIEAKLRLQSSTISGNTVSGDGGGIYARGGILTVLSSTVQDNQASDYGGGLLTSRVIGSKTDLRITGSLFSGNHAGDAGGGVLAGGDGSVEISNSRFLENAAERGGGGLYLRSSLGPISIVNSVISQNTSGVKGGGLVLGTDAAGVAVRVNRTLVADNITSGNGGGIYITGSTGSLTIANSTVRDNIAKETGGGIWTGSKLILIRTAVTGNIAPDSPQIFEQFLTT